MGALSPMGRMLVQPGHSDLAAYYTGTKEVHAKASLLTPPLILIRHASQELAARVSHLCTKGGGRSGPGERWGARQGSSNPAPVGKDCGAAQREISLIPALGGRTSPYQDADD